VRRKRRRVGVARASGKNRRRGEGEKMRIAYPRREKREIYMKNLQKEKKR